MPARLASLLASIWLGWVTALGGVFAPSLFALLDRGMAGRVAGANFRVEAQASLALGVVLLLLHRKLAAQRAMTGHGSVMSAEVLLCLGALFCTVIGYFALQPMMEFARQGVGNWSFGVLHAVSSAFFLIKALLLFALVWRGSAAGRAC